MTMIDGLINLVGMLLVMAREHQTSFAVASSPETHVSRGLPEILPNATCFDWAAWIPSASDPAIVLQVLYTGTNLKLGSNAFNSRRGHLVILGV